MICIRGPDQARRISDPDVRRLVEERFAQVCAGELYDPDVHGEMVVVEPGDTLAYLEAESGCPVASNPFDGVRFPDPDFVPVGGEFVVRRRSGARTGHGSAVANRSDPVQRARDRARRRAALA